VLEANRNEELDVDGIVYLWSTTCHSHGGKNERRCTLIKLNDFGTMRCNWQREHAKSRAKAGVQNTGPLGVRGETHG